MKLRNRETEADSPAIVAERLGRSRPDSTANYEAAVSVWSRFRGGVVLGPRTTDGGGGVGDDDDDDDQMDDDFDFDFDVEPAGEWKPGDRWALVDASFEVHSGEALALVGAADTGAATALQILDGSLPPDRGRVVITGRATRTADFNFHFAPKVAPYAAQAKSMAIAARVPRGDRKRWVADLLRFALYDADGALVEADDKILTKRLATAASIDPTADVLLVDDIPLFDERFRSMCIARVRDALDAGAVVVMRSSKPLPLVELCTRALRFEEGVVVDEGEPRALLEAEYRRTLTASRARSVQQHLPGFNGQCAILGGRVVAGRSGPARIAVELETAQSQLALDPRLVFRSQEGRAGFALRSSDRFTCATPGRYRLSVAVTLPDDTPQVEVDVIVDVFNRSGGYSQLGRRGIGEIRASVDPPELEGADVGDEADYEELQLSAEWTIEAEDA